MDLTFLVKVLLPLGLITLVHYIYTVRYPGRYFAMLAALHDNTNTRCLQYIVVSGLSIIIFTALGQITLIPYVFFPARLAYGLHVYLCLCWTKINKAAADDAADDDGNNQQPAHTRNAYFVRPVAALLLILIMGFQIMPFIVEPDQVKYLFSLEDMGIKLSDTWLWLAGITVLLYGTTSLGLFVYELRGLLKSSTAGVNKLWFAYRCYSLVVVAGIEICVFVPDIMAHITYRLGSEWHDFAKTCATLSSLVTVVGILTFGLLIPLDRWLERRYESYVKKQCELRLVALRALYDTIHHISPTSYPQGAYDQPTTALFPSQTRLKQVVVELDDFRRTIWRAETALKAQVTATATTTKQVTIATTTSIADEAALWVKYINDNAYLVKAIEQTVGKMIEGAVPALPVDGLSDTAKYYNKISKAVEKSFASKLTEVGSGSGSESRGETF